MPKLSFLFFLFIILQMKVSRGEEIDTDLLNSLKIEAGHNLKRLKSLEDEKKNRKIYENEREKSLGLYLEEQEKWDLQREKGLAEYRKNKKSQSPADDGPEFKIDQQQKKKEEARAEKNRDRHVKTRNQVLQKNTDLIEKYESEELGLLNLRPRYDLRQRGRNKWAKSGVNSKPSSGGGFTPSPSDSDNGFPPPPPADYIPAPPPSDGYEEIPPPPPPPNYDYGTGMPYDSGYGDVPPPPPPPPPDYDF